MVQIKSKKVLTDAEKNRQAILNRSIAGKTQGGVKLTNVGNVVSTKGTSKTGSLLKGINNEQPINPIMGTQKGQELSIANTKKIEEAKANKGSTQDGSQTQIGTGVTPTTTQTGTQISPDTSQISDNQQTLIDMGFSTGTLEDIQGIISAMGENTAEERVQKEKAQAALSGLSQNSGAGFVNPFLDTSSNQILTDIEEAQGDLFNDEFEEKTRLQTEIERMNAIDKLQFDTAADEGLAATQSATAQFSQGREDVMSKTNPLLASQFQKKVATQLEIADRQIVVQQDRRAKLLKDLNKAFADGNEDLASKISDKLAVTANNIQQQQTELAKLQAENSKIAFDFLDVMGEGAIANMDVADIMGMTGLDFGTASSIQRLDAQREANLISSPEYKKKMADLQNANLTTEQKNFNFAQDLPVGERDKFLNFAGKNPTFGFIKDDNGNILATNPDTSEVTIVHQSTDADGWGTDAPASGYRTDRHNNPTAVMYEGFNSVLTKLGYEEGVDFEKGDAFPGNDNLHTVKFKDVETGIQAGVDIIDSEGFYTQSGQQRWSHTAMSKNEWNALNETQKDNVIKEMYRKEGGDGSIFGDSTSTTDTGGNRLPELINRMSKVNLGLTGSKPENNLELVQEAYRTGGYDAANELLEELEVDKWGDRAEGIVNDFNKDIANFKDIQEKSSQMDEALAAFKEGVSPLATDQALISLFNKITDPGSVVRESEFNRTADSLGFADKIWAKPQKWIEGGVGITDENRGDIVKLAKALAEGAKSSFISAKNTAINRGTGMKLPEEFLFSQLGLNTAGEFGVLDIVEEEVDDTANDINIWNSSSGANDEDTDLYNNLNNEIQ